MAEIDDGHVSVGGRVVGESTQIVLTAKTLYIIVGIIISGFLSVYGLIKSDITKVQDQNKEVIKNTTEIVEKLKIYELKPIEDKVNQHDRDIGILIDRTNSRSNTNMIGNAPTENSAPPTFP